MSDDVDERPIMIDNIHHPQQQHQHQQQQQPQQSQQSQQPHPGWDALILPPVPPRSNNPPLPPSAAAPTGGTGAAPGQHHHSSDSSRRHLSTSRGNNHHGQHSSDPYPKSSNKGGVRGRVTVVCAEVCSIYISYFSLFTPFFSTSSTFPLPNPDVPAAMWLVLLTHPFTFLGDVLLVQTAQGNAHFIS